MRVRGLTQKMKGNQCQKGKLGYLVLVFLLIFKQALEYKIKRIILWSTVSRCKLFVTIIISFRNIYEINLYC